MSSQGAVRGDVAIVGMAGTFSQAPDVTTFWRNVLARVDAIVDCPDDRWDTQLYFDPSGERDDRVYCKRGGYITHPLPFEPAAHGIMPVSVEGGEAEQFLVFGLVKQALSNGGFSLDALPRQRTETVIARGNYLTSGLTSLFMRAQGVEDVLRVLRRLHPEHTDGEIEKIRQELRAGLPQYNAETAVSLIPNVMSGRVANRLDLMGANYTIDAACASSLVATETVVRDLLTDKCDFGIVGAAHTFSNITFLTMFCTFKALSRSGKCRAFDAEADGTVPGDGAGVLLLKRLADAERDKNRIYAVIKGVGVASDGKALSLVAPRPEGEELALQRAYEVADVPVDSVELIEAHGTGTLVGDETEIRTLKKVFGERSGELPSVAVGSVKSMVGHCMPASGMAGILKTALALHHRVLPPTLHCDHPNPKFELNRARVYLNTETRPWFRRDPRRPRRAGVNAFGFGGINSHLVLEEYAPSSAAAQDEAPWESELVVFRAETRELLGRELERTRRWLAAAPAETSLVDVAGTLSQTAAGAWTLTVVAQSHKDLSLKLDRALPKVLDSTCASIRDLSGIYFDQAPLGKNGKVAFVFPGGNSQYVNMLRELCLHFPEVMDVFEAEDRRDVALGRPDPLTRFVFPPSFTEGSDEKLFEPARLIQSLLAGNRAMARLLSAAGVKPDMVVGHSQGEWSALEAAGTLSLEPEAETLRQVDALSQKLGSHFRTGDLVTATIFEGREAVEALSRAVEGKIYLTADNCPHQTVAAGLAAPMEAFLSLLKTRGVLAERTALTTPAHTPLCGPFQDFVRQLFELLPLRPSRVPAYSATTAAPFDQDLTRMREQLAETWVRPVEFRRTIEAMYAAGARVFVEVGPRATLTAFVGDTLRSRPHLVVASDLHSRGGVTQLHHCLAQLIAHGVGVNVSFLFSRRRFNRLRFTEVAQPAKRKPGVIELSLRNPRLDVSPGVAAQLRSVPSVAAPTPARETGNSSPMLEPENTPDEAVMARHLQMMQRFLEMQGELMLRVGSDPAMSETVSFETTLPDGEMNSIPLEPELPVDATTATAALTNALLALVSDKTGYPVDLLGLDLDLEADLGIDSLKRLEILLAFQKAHLAGSALPEKGTKLRTLRQVVETLCSAH